MFKRLIANLSKEELDMIRLGGVVHYMINGEEVSIKLIGGEIACCM